MAFSGSGLHLLKGKLAAFWALKVARWVEMQPMGAKPTGLPGNQAANETPELVRSTGHQRAIFSFPHLQGWPYHSGWQKQRMPRCLLRHQPQLHSQRGQTASGNIFQEFSQSPPSQIAGRMFSSARSILRSTRLIEQRSLQCNEGEQENSQPDRCALLVAIASAHQRCQRRFGIAGVEGDGNVGNPGSEPCANQLASILHQACRRSFVSLRLQFQSRRVDEDR